MFFFQWSDRKDERNYRKPNGAQFSDFIIIIFSFFQARWLLYMTLTLVPENFTFPGPQKKKAWTVQGNTVRLHLSNIAVSHTSLINLWNSLHIAHKLISKTCVILLFLCFLAAIMKCFTTKPRKSHKHSTRELEIVWLPEKIFPGFLLPRCPCHCHTARAHWSIHDPWQTALQPWWGT